MLAESIEKLKSISSMLSVSLFLTFGADIDAGSCAKLRRFLHAENYDMNY